MVYRFKFCAKIVIMKKRAVVYDFDNTIWHSHDRESGMQLYLKEMKVRWPHVGWYGRIETLQYPFVAYPVDEKYLVTEVFNQYKIDKGREDTNIYLMTGRPLKMKSHIVELLNKVGMTFDRYFFKTNFKDTIIEKLKNISDEIIHPDLEILEIWEDRSEHVDEFLKESRNNWIEKLKTIVIHDVTANQHYTVQNLQKEQNED